MNAIKGKFSFDGEHYYNGFTTGEKWNGFECPMFGKSNAQKIKQDINKNADFKTDCAYFSKHENAFIIDGDTIKAQIIQHNGKNIEVFPIGAFCWTWERKEKESINQ